MADSSPLPDLLERARNVFSLAGRLGEAFYEEGQARAIHCDPSIWHQHSPTFDEFCERLLELRGAMEKPPDGFEPVAERLLEAAKLARRMKKHLAREAGKDKSSWGSSHELFGQTLGVENPGPPDFTAYWEFYPDFNSVSANGLRTVDEVVEAHKLDDPFAFVDELSPGDAATAGLSLLDRFPATPLGHVAFLQMVRDEVHNAAEAKRQQAMRGYSNDTLASMVQGIKWAEAARRISLLSDLPADATESVTRVLRRELTVGTVEQINELLTPAVYGLRDAFERARAIERAKNSVVVNTAGDLWKAYAEGRRPCHQISSFSFRSGANTPTVTCPEPADEAKRVTLDRAEALVTAEGGEKAAAMERLIARVQLKTGMDKASVINMPLADFVAAAKQETQTSNVADDRREFIELAEEIIARIEENKGPEWWDGIKPLCEQLEKIRRRIQPPTESQPNSKYPALLICEVYRDSVTTGFAKEFGEYLTTPFQNTDISGFGEMHTRDPRVVSFSQASLWIQRGKGTRVYYEPREERAGDAIVTLRRWIRFFRTAGGEDDVPPVDDKNEPPAIETFGQLLDVVRKGDATITVKTWPGFEAFQTLNALCWSLYGSAEIEQLRRVAGKVAIGSGLRIDELRKLPLEEFVRLAKLHLPEFLRESDASKAGGDEPSQDTDPDDRQAERVTSAGEDAQKASSDPQKKRRGARGYDPFERFSQIEKVYQHEIGEIPLTGGNISQIKRRVRNWIERDWDKEYKDGGGRWRDALSEAKQIELSRMRDELLEKWRVD